MLDKQLIAFANAYNFECETDYAYGVIDGYMVSVSNVGSKKAAFINFFLPIDEENSNTKEYEISQEISALELKALDNCEVTESSVYFYTSASLTEFDDAILKVCAVLADKGTEGASVCCDCGCDIDRKSCKALLNSGKLSLLCDDCADYFNDNSYREQAPEKSASKAKGIIGSVVGGFVGLIAVLALYILLPFSGAAETFGGALNSDMLIFTLPASAFISVCCFLFYRLFTGIKGNKRFFCGVTCSLIFSILNTYGATAVLYTKQFAVGVDNIPKVLGIILQAPFTDAVYRDDFFKYLFFGLIAVVVVSLVYSIIYDDAKTTAPRIITLDSSESEEIEETEEVEEAKEESEL